MVYTFMGFDKNIVIYPLSQYQAEQFYHHKSSQRSILKPTKKNTSSFLSNSQDMYLKFLPGWTVIGYGQTPLFAVGLLLRKHHQMCTHFHVTIFYPQNSTYYHPGKKTSGIPNVKCVCMCVCVCVCVYVYLCVCVYINVHTHTHTHIYIYMSLKTPKFCLNLHFQPWILPLPLCQLFATSWTVAFQTPLSMELTRQEYWSGLSLSGILLSGSQSVVWRPLYHFHLKSSVHS